MFALIKKDIIFTKKWILLSVVYAVLESIVVTVISILFNQQYNGIVFEAVTYTMIAFFTMLILYRFGVIRATGCSGNET